MTAQVSKVNPPRKGKNGGIYQKIELLIQPENYWTYTYVSTGHYNGERWQKIIDAPQGVWVEQLEWKDEAKRLIDADSKVIFHNRKYEKQNPIDQMTLF